MIELKPDRGYTVLALLHLIPIALFIVADSIVQLVAFRVVDVIGASVLSMRAFYLWRQR